MKWFSRLFGPPSESQFARLLLRELGRVNPHRQYQHEAARDRVIVSEDGQAVGTINLPNLYRTFLATNKPERAEYLRKLSISLSHQPELPEEFADVRPDLRPAVRSRSMQEFTRLAAEVDGGNGMDLVSIPLSEFLTTHLVYDLPNAVRYVTSEDLDTWGVTVYEALEAAVENLEQDPRTIVAIDRRVYSFCSGDSYDSSRMLLLDCIAGLELQGAPVAIPLNRDTLLISGADDEAGLDLICQLIAGDEQVGIRPVCAVPHILRDGTWEPWIAGEDHPCFNKLKALWLRHIGSEYAEQQELLQEWVNRQEPAPYVAAYSGVEQASRYFSYCVWTKGIPIWLPKTDLVAFVDTETGFSEMTTWDRVVAEFGHLMSPVECWPPRWAVDAFPAYDALQKIKISLEATIPPAESSNEQP